MTRLVIIIAKLRNSTLNYPKDRFASKDGKLVFPKIIKFIMITFSLQIWVLTWFLGLQFIRPVYRKTGYYSAAVQ